MNWTKTEPPRRKADYVGKFLLLNDDVPPIWHDNGREMPRFRPKSGDVARISRRMNAKETAYTSNDVASWGNIRVLKLELECGHCGDIQASFIPESWIAEGKAHFVEKSS